jgi:hypothetical protein
MRPKSLAEVARLALQGEPFDACLANFLDEFYASPNASAIVDEPPVMAREEGDMGAMQDAYLAAVAEESSRKHFIVLPRWTAADNRHLRRPWFASSLASLRAVLLLESPAAFRARNLFVSENALTRV